MGCGAGAGARALATSKASVEKASTSESTRVVLGASLNWDRDRDGADEADLSLQHEVDLSHPHEEHWHLPGWHVHLAPDLHPHEASPEVTTDANVLGSPHLHPAPHLQSAHVQFLLFAQAGI